MIQARGQRGRRGQNGPEEKLPPHDPEAEKAALGSVLVDVGSARVCLQELVDQFGDEEPFYVSAHAVIYRALRGLYAEGKELDFISLQSRLKDTGRLDEVGGLAYLTSLEGLPTLTREYGKIIWNKHLGRQMLRDATEIANQVMAGNGLSETLLVKQKRLHEELETKTRRGSMTPQYLKRATDFHEEFHNHFFGTKGEVPGLELPIPFPLKIRRGETTLIFGDDGSGKSTLLNYFALHLAAQGEKIFVASLEMPPATTLWMLASQLLGSKWQPDTREAKNRTDAALVWLDKHFIFYDFLGISHWRDILDTLRYAVEHDGVTTSIGDSVMRMGIADDDYSQQGFAAAAFAQFAQDHDIHGFWVMHENKGDNKGKAKVRGSKLWTANMWNVLQVEINHKKGIEAGKKQWDLDMARKHSHPNQQVIKDLEEELDDMKKWWDTQLTLRKQRYPGTQQNGSKRFWFDPANFQFRSHWEDPAVNWLERWKRRERQANSITVESQRVMPAQLAEGAQ